jgi:YKOF-related Family.
MNITCNLDGSVDVTGCKLSIYPMKDQFVDIILGAVNQLNQVKLPVWSQTICLVPRIVDAKKMWSM